MEPFQKAYYPEDHIEKMKQAIAADLKQKPDLLKQVFNEPNPTNETIESAAEYLAVEGTKGEVFRNDKYQVCITETEATEGVWPKLLHLSIKRIDKEIIHDWRELQEIKNMLLGPEFEAVELYPAESRLVDSANQYHLFALAENGLKFPFGFTSRLVSNESLAGSRQRPRPEKEPENDRATSEE